MYLQSIKLSAVYQANNSLPKINQFADKIIELNKHQDDLDAYANQFRSLGKYKGNVLTLKKNLMLLIRLFRRLMKGLN